jgi:galactan endo-1,6-beta-galactosidase
MVSSPNIPPWKQIEAYWMTPKEWDWSRDGRQRGVLFSALSLGVVKRVEVFSNSPVWWQCANFNPSGSVTGTTNNLNELHVQDHVTHVASVAAFLKKSGAPVASVELFNEPSASWWKWNGEQEGCRIGPHEQMLALRYLPLALARASLHDVRIAASDESFVDQALRTWELFDAETKRIVQQVNVHGYQQGGDREALYDAAVRRDGKILRDSEYGDGDGSGQTMLKSIMKDWQELHPLGWCYWQAVDPAIGWGLLAAKINTTDWKSSTVEAVNTKYFAAAQMTRHIRPQMAVLRPTDKSKNLTLAARANNTVVVVVANLDGSSETVNLSIVGFGPCSTAAWARWDTNVTSSTPDPRNAYTYKGLHTTRCNSNRTVLSFAVPSLTLSTLEIELR